MKYKPLCVMCGDQAAYLLPTRRCQSCENELMDKDTGWIYKSGYKYGGPDPFSDGRRTATGGRK